MSPAWMTMSTGMEGTGKGRGFLERARTWVSERRRRRVGIVSLSFGFDGGGGGDEVDEVDAVALGSGGLAVDVVIVVVRRLVVAPSYGLRSDDLGVGVLEPDYEGVSEHMCLFST